ncbi:MAG: GNAT family N-acetyltransferase [Planctomycetes bacterium]|nr:GNAT family N-acetyltransferase [Planctomycetota bacterium]
MTYDVSTDPARIDTRAVWEMLRASYWSARIRRDILEKAIANSICCGAYDSATGAQVGFARAVTDGATFAWLCDVIVREDHRGRGLSKRMVETLLAHPDTQSLRRWVLATRDAHGLYERYGFVPVPQGNWLERKSDPSVWTER